MVVLLLFIELLNSVISRFYFIENLFFLRLIWIVLLLIYLQFKTIKINAILSIAWFFLIGFVIILFGEADFSKYKILINTVFIILFFNSSFNKKRGIKLLRYYFYYFVFNGFLSVLGLMFEIPFFKSEFNSERFGYTGLLPVANNELFYLLVLFAFINSTKVASFFNNSLLILSGLKSTFVAFFLLRVKYLFILVPLFFLVILFSPIIDLLNSIVLEYFLYFYKERGLLYVLTSGRFERLELFELSLFPSKTFKNFEMDLITIIYNFGILFSLSFLIVYVRFFKIFLKRNEKLLFYLFLAAALLMGHLIDSILSMILILTYVTVTKNKNFNYD